MSRPKSQQPTDAELEILQVLWDRGPMALGQVRAAIQESRAVATTTIATMLTVMLEKGLVKRSQGERAYVWSARVTRKVATRRILARVIDGMFAGSASGLVAHLIEDGKLDDVELDEIRKLVEGTDDGDLDP